MLYSGDNPILRIVSVEHLRWSGGYFSVAPRDYAALAFRIEGSAVIGAGDEEYTIAPSDILYLPQGLGYTACYTDTEILVIHFITERTDKSPERYAMHGNAEISNQFLQLHALWVKKEPGYAVYALSRLYEILGTICKRETRNNLPPHFLKALSYIHAHYKDSSLSVGTICADVGIGQTAFRQMFKKYCQKTPVAYITDLRLEYARGLIAGDRPIELAALESGFGDPKYFARVVKRRFGCTPRDLRAYGK